MRFTDIQVESPHSEKNLTSFDSLEVSDVLDEVLLCDWTRACESRFLVHVSLICSLDEWCRCTEAVDRDKMMGEVTMERHKSSQRSTQVAGKSAQTPVLVKSARVEMSMPFHIVVSELLQEFLRTLVGATTQRKRSLEKWESI